MRDGWKRVKLGEVCEVDYGTRIRKLESKGDAFPVYGGGGETFRWATFNRENRFVISRFAISPTCVRHVYGRFYLNDSGLTVNAISGIAEQGFVDYALLNMQPQIYNLADGTAQRNLNVKAFRDLEVALPPLPTQRSIAAVLGALDDKIELNRRMNANLEEQAQSLFKSWFVDFAPWGGKMPEGWKKGVAEDFYQIKIGKTPPRKEQGLFSLEKSNNVVWVSIADMGTCGMFISDSSEYLVPNAIETYNIRVSDKDTVLLSFKLTVGRVAIADCPLSTNEAIAHFVPMCKVCKEYTYFYLKTFNYERLGSTSSIATAVNSKMVRAMPFVLPEDGVLCEFQSKVAPLTAMIRKNLNESRKLAELRDALLPKLMSGELAVGDVL